MMMASWSSARCLPKAMDEDSVDSNQTRDEIMLKRCRGGFSARASRYSHATVELQQLKPLNHPSVRRSLPQFRYGGAKVLQQVAGGRTTYFCDPLADG